MSFVSGSMREEWYACGDKPGEKEDTCHRATRTVLQRRLHLRPTPGGEGGRGNATSPCLKKANRQIRGRLSAGR